MADSGWLVIEGERSAALAQTLQRRVQDKISSDKLSRDEIMRVAKLDLSTSANGLKVSDETLDKLRRLCQLWDVDIRYSGILSHRPVIGPLIVGLKKIMYPLLRAFLKDSLRQQRDFNAAAVSLLADLAGRLERGK